MMRDITDMAALQRWKQINKVVQDKILSNVFCPDCFNTTIVDYSIHSDMHGIVLQGKCLKCGKDVARYVEDE